MKVKSELIQVASELLTSVQLSEYAEDWDVKMPKHVLKKIEA